MIPGGWVGAAAFFIVVGAVALSAIFAYVDVRKDAREKRHEREMAKLEHRQSLDKTAIEAEFARDDDDEAEPEDGDVVLAPTLVESPFTGRQVQLGDTEVHVDCIACGKHIPAEAAVDHEVPHGGVVPSCPNHDCRTDARAIVDPSRPP